MNYKKLIIVILILYILYNCFKVREGFISKNKTGNNLREFICKNINIGGKTKINIDSFDYDDALKCKKNFRYKSVGSNSEKKIKDCQDNYNMLTLSKKDKANYFPAITRLNTLSNKDKFNHQEIKTIMNCHLLNHKINKFQYVKDIYGKGKFSEKFTIDLVFI